MSRKILKPLLWEVLEECLRDKYGGRPVALKMLYKSRAKCVGFHPQLSNWEYVKRYYSYSLYHQ